MTPDKYNAEQHGIPYITGASNIEAGKVIINRWTEYARAFAYQGELLLTCKGTVGTMAILQEEKVHIARQIMAIHPIKGIEMDFLQMVIESFVDELQSAAKSMIPGITREDILTAFFPIPSQSEQKRIINRYYDVLPLVEEYGAKEDALSKLNASLPAILKKSILQEAIQGKLVPQDPNDEPASVLLERIHKEKARLVKEGKLKPDKHESVIFRRDNSHYEKLDGKERCVDDEIPFEIPNGWCWCNLQMITINIHYGFTASATTKGNAKLLRITDIQNNIVQWEKVPFCNVTRKDLNTYQLHNRDIMIARTGGTIGKTYIIRKLTETAVFASYLIRAIPIEQLDEEYLKIFMESPLYWKQLNEFSAGTGQPNVNGQSLKKLLLPLPPLNEQHRIVEAIERLFARLNK